MPEYVCTYLHIYTEQNKKLKEYTGAISLVEEILGQHSTQAVAWLFIPIVIQIYNKSEQKD